MKKIKLIVSILAGLILFITALLFAASVYIHINYSDQSVDEMIYYLTNGLEGTSTDVFTGAIAVSLVPFLLLYLVLLLPIIPFKKRKQIMEVTVRTKKFKFTLLPNKLFYKFRIIYAAIMLLLSAVAGYYLLDVSEYYKRLTSYSTFIDKNYVNGKNIHIAFPDKKRNLILLYIESGENTFIDKDHGGGWSYSVTPEFENIAAQNTNFSNSDKIGGAQSASGATWTVGGLVATTAGIPLKIPVNGNEYTSTKNFLGGAYTLGDILQKEGYNLEFMAGSDTAFGGRSSYYTKHGNYNIFDLGTAIKEGKMTANQKVWWGFDDSHLFTWAEEEITKMASSDKPFSFSFLTANTHFPDGYLEDAAERKFGTPYENVFAFTSKQVNDFVNWFNTQAFSKDTTLVIMGDHLSMEDSKYFNAHVYQGYTRTIYNAFVNPVIQPVNAKNRTFTSMDMFPTILASMGVKIEGNRLGLGTNLFSNKKTLAEEVTLNNFNQELAKNSKFYNNKILQGDFIELEKKSKTEK